MFIDEFLQLFKNQISLDDLKYKLSYKEAVKLKEIRIKRLEKEAKENKFSNDDLEEAFDA